jgi:hypothetical protein
MADYPRIRMASVRATPPAQSKGANKDADVEFIIERTVKGDRDVSILITVDAQPEEEIITKARAVLARVLHELSLQTEAWRT